MAHGKSTVVKAISGVQVIIIYNDIRVFLVTFFSYLGNYSSFILISMSNTDSMWYCTLFEFFDSFFLQTVRFKNELERNITIKLGYANAKIYKCEDERCPRPMCYKYVIHSSSLSIVLDFGWKYYFMAIEISNYGKCIY